MQSARNGRYWVVANGSKVLVVGIVEYVMEVLGSQYGASVGIGIGKPVLKSRY